MTTIAFDGTTLASDSQLTLGDYRLNSKTQKIFVPEADERWFVNGEKAIAFGVAGKLAVVQAVREALASVMFGYKGLTTATRFPKGYTLKYIVLTEKGQVYTGGQYEDDDVPWMALASAPIAVGSGCEFAIGAMAAGVSAESAVKIAEKFDINTGGDVQVFALPEK